MIPLLPEFQITRRKLSMIKSAEDLTVNKTNPAQPLVAGL